MIGLLITLVVVLFKISLIALAIVVIINLIGCIIDSVGSAIRSNPGPEKTWEEKKRENKKNEEQFATPEYYRWKRESEKLERYRDED